ncbi:MAG: ATP cone domain-containing protein [Thermoproteus sp.]
MFTNKVVIKRDGSREPFIYEKLVVSILKAGADVESARTIAFKVICRLFSGDPIEVTSEQIRSMVLEELQKVNGEWYSRWIEFEQTVKRKKMV